MKGKPHGDEGRALPRMRPGPPRPVWRAPRTLPCARTTKPQLLARRMQKMMGWRDGSERHAPPGAVLQLVRRARIAGELRPVVLAVSWRLVGGPAVRGQALPGRPGAQPVRAPRGGGHGHWDVEKDGAVVGVVEVRAEVNEVHAAPGVEARLEAAAPAARVDAVAGVRAAACLGKRVAHRSVPRIRTEPLVATGRDRHAPVLATIRGAEARRAREEGGPEDAAFRQRADRHDEGPTGRHVSAAWAQNHERVGTGVDEGEAAPAQRPALALRTVVPAMPDSLLTFLFALAVIRGGRGGVAPQQPERLQSLGGQEPRRDGCRGHPSTRARDAGTERWAPRGRAGGQRRTLGTCLA
mmetsp:Transcript_91466/g.279917  ORF Transcript_91466/g.279917 Transcript_91466/m.279917 type:complete len:353 (-) Transcript_91466:23-1081(-)